MASNSQGKRLSQWALHTRRAWFLFSAGTVQVWCTDKPCFLWCFSRSGMQRYLTWHLDLMLSKEIIAGSQHRRVEMTQQRLRFHPTRRGSSAVLHPPRPTQPATHESDRKGTDPQGRQTLARCCPPRVPAPRAPTFKRPARHPSFPSPLPIHAPLPLLSLPRPIRRFPIPRSHRAHLQSASPSNPSFRRHPCAWFPPNRLPIPRARALVSSIRNTPRSIGFPPFCSLIWRGETKSVWEESFVDPPSELRGALFAHGMLAACALPRSLCLVGAGAGGWQCGHAVDALVVFAVGGVRVTLRAAAGTAAWGCRWVSAPIDISCRSRRLMLNGWRSVSYGCWLFVAALCVRQCWSAGFVCLRFCAEALMLNVMLRWKELAVLCWCCVLFVRQDLITIFKLYVHVVLSWSFFLFRFTVIYLFIYLFCLVARSCVCCKFSLLLN
jgi:hypothetical protein